MEKKKSYRSALRINAGVESPPSINPDVVKENSVKKRKKYSITEYVDGILSGNRIILSQAITLIESALPDHYETAQAVIESCLPYSSKSIRIGITGVPGAGKSTFIETFGLHVTGLGRTLAVLTVDPSSDLNKGSILGDKTRMERLSVHPDVFVRPTPSSGTLGGVARKTRETIILCESAGFNTILVETVGVGQSETSVRSMVDCFILLMLAGAGDELQGIKRGITEMADLIAITKADGANKNIADGAKVSFQNSLHMLAEKSSGWEPRVVTCSALENSGIEELWEIIVEYMDFITKSGYLNEQRSLQSVDRMHSTINDFLKNKFYNSEEIKILKAELEKQLYEGRITSYKAALKLLDKFFHR